MSDYRDGVAEYYDLAPHHPNDVPFYIAKVPSPGARILELGCGTGRVSLPLAEHCSFLQGVDHSASMLAVFESKLEASGLSEGRIRISAADISAFDLSERFDLIIAPFRVIQNLETDARLEGLFRCIARHLGASGRCILNVFHPNRGRDQMVESWASSKDSLAWEVATENGKVVCYDRRVSVQASPLVVYPQLVYRRFIGDDLVDEAVLDIAMRCFYPEEFLTRIDEAGFIVTASWGDTRVRSTARGRNWWSNSRWIVKEATTELTARYSDLTGPECRSRRRPDRRPATDNVVGV